MNKELPGQHTILHQKCLRFKSEQFVHEEIALRRAQEQLIDDSLAEEAANDRNDENGTNATEKCPA